MSTLLELHERAFAEFGRRVHAVGPDQWSAATPCTDWTVRDLVNHLAAEQLWVPPLLGGAKVEQVGSRFDGDVLGADPVSAWDSAATAARAALAEPGALERTVHLSYGDRPAEYYVRELTSDLLLHAWDLARALGTDETLDAELVNTVLTSAEPNAGDLAASGLFNPPVPVPADADPQTRLIALFGRTP
ncbi:MAG TPA: TIGR03086 family metal-binding protein [Actinocrinis sp.]|nr:TIGR03086 family metal-binding protein [Actinocrinis sp.]